MPDPGRMKVAGREKITTYRDLEVWKRGMDLVVEIYKVASELPTQEKFGLVSQLQRAAVSVPSNIAEGHARLHRGDYVHHLSMARGSLAEVETLLIAAGRLGMLDRERATPAWVLCGTVGRLLNRLIRSLRTPAPPPTADENDSLSAEGEPDHEASNTVADKRNPTPDPRSPTP